MRTVILTITLALVAAAASAQTPVTLKAPDGIAIKGTYYSAGKPGPALMLLHQCNSDRSAWAGFAQQAVTRGYHVLAIDYRGFGESEGERFASPANRQALVARWPADIDVAFAWLTAQPGVDKARIGAAGASCGVNQAILLSRRHPEVRSVVLLSGALTPEARTHVRETPSLSILAAASDDDGDAVPTMRWILGWSRNPGNKLLQFKAAGHGTDMFAVEPGLQPQILGWFETTLRNVSTASTSTAGAAPQGKPSAIEEFWSALTQPGGVARARAIYDAAKSAAPAAQVLFPQGEMNAFGYQLIQEGRAREAIIAFQMNVDAYPSSANAYDSLSDGYLEDGNTTEALRLAEKALELLPKDMALTDEVKALVKDSAQRKVDQLRKKQ
jgi:dienelactone hydrolase